MRMLRSFRAQAFLVAAVFTSITAQAQTPGLNVNMVSGTKWPGGDPFLQRQNEPSLAVSTRNPVHLLAGANDYRSVDIPNPNSPDERGDAWLGVFKSFDGGATWGSTLLAGYPQDQSAAGMASPLHGLSTAADPTVRAGTNGLFYYSGIAYNRGTNLGVIFIARFMDLDNLESGDASQSLDPIRYINTVQVDTGTSGQFLDKPWIATDIPRGTATCNIQVPQGAATVTQTVPAGNVYAVWSRFTGSQSTKIMFSRSMDCGATWSTPIKLSAGNLVNQGTTIAVDPKTGKIWVAWRRFVSSSSPDAIVGMVSTDFGQTFSNAVDIVDLPLYNASTPNAPSFFDQDTAPGGIRVHSFPTIGVDGNGVAYAAWSQRGLPFATGGDARIAMSTSTDGVTWSAPKAVDSGPLMENGLPILDSSGNQLVRGHQVMPQITTNAGQLFVLYYDLREDHTISFFPPNSPFAPDANGSFFQEERQLEGELTAPGNIAQVFTPFLTDANLTQRRHTLDLVVAQADTNKSPLAFTTARVSRYKFGLRNDGTDTIGPDGFPILQQLQEDPPNLPLFEQGQDPFMGDYVDIAGLAFVPTDSSGKNWAFNTSPSSLPVVYATWTSNQDVVPPADGDWTHYTPVGGGGPSIFNPGTTTPACSTGQQGMRNQNIYMSQITQGLVLSSPQNQKPLNTTFQRGFGIFMQNLTNFDKSFLLSISNQPVGGWASFLPAQGNPLPAPGSFLPTTTLNVTVPAHSGVARMVFATSTSPTANILVTAAELASGGAGLKPGGLSSFVTLNPDPTAPALLNPPGNTAGDVSNTEVFSGSLVNVGVTDPNIDGSLVNSSYIYGSLLNGSLVNADVNSGSLVNGSLVNGSLVNGSLLNGSLVNGSLVNGSLVNGSLVNSGLANFGLASGSLLNTTLANGSLVNGSLVNGSLVNGSLVNGSLVNGPVSDLSYTFTHNGNTAGSYTIGLIGNPSTPPTLQLIVTKTYYTTTSDGCVLAQEPHNVVLSNVNNPLLLDPTTTNPSDPVITDPNEGRSTIVLGPGETAVITLRGVNLSPTSLHGLTTQLGPLVTSQACNTGDPQCGVRFFAAPLLISTATLPGAQVGVPYSVTLANFGGMAPFNWSIPQGVLPGGLTLSSAGVLSGTPLAAGAFPFTVSVSDSSSPQNSNTRPLTLNVSMGTTTTTLTASSTSLVFGQQVTLTATVSPGAGTPTGTVTFSDGATVLGTVPLVAGVASFNTSSFSLGNHSIASSYSGDANYLPSASSAVQLSVAQASTATTISASPAAPVFGQALTLTATVSVNAPGTGTPTGTVTFTDSGNPLGTANLSGGSGSLTISSLSVGSHSFSATYGGDANFTRSSPSVTFVQAIAQASTNSVITSSVNPSVFGQAVTFSATVSVVAPGAGTPSGSVKFLDGATVLGTVPLTAGTASLTTSSTLAVGGHSITVSYTGSGSFVASTSPVLMQTVNPASTTTSLASSNNPSVYGQVVTFSAGVSVIAPGVGMPSGNVLFRDGGTALGTSPLIGGAATLPISSLTAGNHSITASYVSNGGFAASTSTALAQAVNKASTTTTISSITPNPVVLGKPVTVTFSVSAAGAGAPMGIVTVSDGAGATCVATLAATSCSLTSITIGSHTLTATYSGDANFGGSSGNSSVQEAVTYAFLGFLSPLGTAGTVAAPTFSGSVNRGSAVPLKWELLGSSGNVISDPGSLVSIVACPSSGPTATPGAPCVLLYSPTTGAKGNSTFRFSSPQFIFNWDTSSTIGSVAGFFTVEVQLNDGSPAKATTIQFK